MDFLLEPIRALREYKLLSAAVRGDKLPAGATGLSHIHKANLIAALCAEQKSRALILVSDEGEAQRLGEDLEAFGLPALFFPARDLTFRPVDSVSREYEYARIGTLSRMLDGNYGAVIASIDAAALFTIPPEELDRRRFTLSPGETISPDTLIERLLAAGYARADQVEGAGQFARRGVILDFHTPDMADAVRCEFWGDEIDSIWSFDIKTQRRLEPLKEVQIPPVVEALCDAGVLAEKIEKLATKLKSKAAAPAKENLLREAARLREGVYPATLDKYLPLCYHHPATIFDYAEDALLFVSETGRVKERHRTFAWQMGEDIKGSLEAGLLAPGLDNFSLDFTAITTLYERHGAVYLDAFARGEFDTVVHELADFTARQLSPWGGGVEVLKEDLDPALDKGYACVVLAGSDKNAEILAEDLRKEGLPAIFAKNPGTARRRQVTVAAGGLSQGFEYPGGDFLLITHGHMQHSAAPGRKRKNAGESLSSLEELERGDYVVHASHGIGIFDGIEKKTVQGVTKDYIKIKYQNNDVLFVPVAQLDMVSKYIDPSHGEAPVKLHRLGGTEWQKTKSRVKAAVRDMAKELTQLYAQRMNTKGYAFGPDTDMQNDFERRFEFTETEDQLRCVREIKEDMERAVPMDRLLCGDVGFGKTEVALRGAFKCVAEGKQCAFLVPTTILAWQHYQTALRRMEELPVTVEMISRFRSPRQQEEILAKVRRGEVDLLIGTHRMISKDVKFHDLGMLIIDEEQRFGVAQKEKMKELFPAVDALTLTATPIPRTLNMAMSGLRDMSVIEEAPEDRHPVQTYVLEYDRGILLDAMRREFRRGGQTYYLHNRVETIEKTAAALATELPEMRIGVAHGQMSEEELSEVWRALIEHEIDVLCCTTIIETGVDVPNCNTLIIENADHMGLAQLYQIRGRVGRSSRRAYAYLTFRPGKVLSDVAQKRLTAIRDFTEFGSGFKIAMRDLEIRGAGNILGGEQHGHMEAVGYDMYLRMLADAVREERGETPDATLECAVDMQVEAHIPEDYIESLPQRLGIYRRIADVRTEEDARDVTDELIDRFGDPPAAVQGLIDVSLLRGRAAACGIYEVTQKSGSMLLFPQKLDMEAAGRLAGKLRGRVMVNAGQKPYLSVRIPEGAEAIDTLRESIRWLSGIDS